jgi:hypothetical protein
MLRLDLVVEQQREWLPVRFLIPILFLGLHLHIRFLAQIWEWLLLIGKLCIVTLVEMQASTVPLLQLQLVVLV